LSEQHAPWWKGERGEWYVVAQIFLFALVIFGPDSLPGLPAWSEPAASIAAVLGALLMVAGALLSASGILRLGGNLTPLPYPKECAELVESGPYRIVRHPIYSGLIIAAFGLALWRNSLLTAAYALILLVFFDIKSRKEEIWLAEKFEGYAEYRTRAKKLLPWIY